MKGSTVLVAVIMALLQDAQSSKTAIVNVAARSGQVANRVIQKMQRMDPNLIQNHLENSRLTFEKIKTSYHWFQKLREVIQKKKEENLESNDPPTSDLEALNKQIQTCRPDTKNQQEQCYSPCIKKKTDYRWCFTSSELRASIWSPCSCKIKPAVLQFLNISRQNLLSKPSDPWTSLEIALVAITSGFGALIIICGSVAGVVYWRRGEGFPLQGNVFPNPSWSIGGTEPKQASVLKS
jgi:hypothetical protein